MCREIKHSCSVYYPRMLSKEKPDAKENLTVVNMHYWADAFPFHHSISSHLPYDGRALGVCLKSENGYYCENLHASCGRDIASTVQSTRAFQIKDILLNWVVIPCLLLYLTSVLNDRNKLLLLLLSVFAARTYSVRRLNPHKFRFKFLAIRKFLKRSRFASLEAGSL